MFGPILQSKNVFIIHKDAMERVATSEEQAGAGQAGHLFIIHKDAMQRVASRVERDRAGQVREWQPQRSKQGQAGQAGHDGRDRSCNSEWRRQRFATIQSRELL